MTEAQKKWHKKNKPRKLEYMRRYRIANLEAVTASTKRWYRNNPEKAAASKRTWAAKNKEKCAAYKKNFSERNKDRIRVEAREYAAMRRDTDANFKLRERLRGQVYSALKRAGAARSARTAALVGCDLQFLRGYIEARFLEGMTWENHGAWHLDHRVPLAEFDLREPAQQRQAFNYTNLQPLWGPDNIRKGAKRPATHQAELI